eukprot:jgi/Galph1/5086/GphlegSOOS_G3702.1
MTDHSDDNVKNDCSSKRKKGSRWSPVETKDNSPEATVEKEEEQTLPHLSDPEEVRHIQRVILAFRKYLAVSTARVDRRRRDFLYLSDEQQSWVPSYLQNLERSKEAIRKNDLLLRNILSTVENFDVLETWKQRKEYVANFEEENSQFELLFLSAAFLSSANPYKYTVECYESDIEKVRSVLLHIMRDWSHVGAEERERCYLPLITATCEAYEATEHVVPGLERCYFRVLVPGAGLGRLAWELAKQGFWVQGNDFTYYSLFSSNYILNYIMEDTEVEGMEFFPFVHQTTDVVDSEDILTPIWIPDVDTRQLPSTSNFSMVAGDFVEVYSSPQQSEQWDCVVTCFFMDTAHNILEYVQVIRRILKKGGFWINLGPLLYHYADTEDEPSIEISLEELQKVVKMFFQIDSEEMRRCMYTRNPRSMLQIEYQCSFFRARKIQ